MAVRRRSLSERGQLDLFRALPGDFAPRDAQDLMAYPFFSLSKTHRTAPIDFVAGKVTIRVEAVHDHGMATIWDADILIWAASQIVEARDAGLRTSRLMAATPYEILSYVGRGTSARDYQRLKGEVAKILAEVTGQPHSIQEVAVHEALANAMECRDGVPRQNQASIRFNKIGGRLIIRVKTSRMGFAGNAVLRRLRSHPEEMFAFGEDASMGRGIPIMLSLTDRMIYNSEGTELLLAWKL